MTGEEIVALASEAWQQHEGQYGFTRRLDSIIPYTEGFKDGFEMALEFFSVTAKPRSKKPVCPKCRHYMDPRIYTYDTLGHCHIIGTKEPSEHCKKCIEAGYSLWEKKDD